MNLPDEPERSGVERSMRTDEHGLTPLIFFSSFVLAAVAVIVKCRHINYESLEAFLCVECGYCAYAHFSFRLIAALETDFTPVTTEVRGCVRNGAGGM